MNLLISLITVLGVSNAHAEMDMQAYAKQASCNQQINMALNSYGFAMNPDGPAFTIGVDGKTMVHDSQRIVSRETANGVETIVYKVKEPRFVDGKTVYEMVRKTVRVKRDGKKVVEVANDYDVKEQLRSREDFYKTDFGKLYKDKPFPLFKSHENKFIHNGDSCETQQTAYYQMQDEKAPVEGKVTFDKKFCDDIKPMISRLGNQNASQCGSLIATAQSFYERRNKELAKENKELVTFGALPGSDKSNLGNSMNLGMMITMCATQSEMANGILPGVGMGMYGAIGMGSITGGGMMGYGGMMGGPAVKDNQKPAKEKAAKGVK